MKVTIRPSANILLPDMTAPPESYFYSAVDKVKVEWPNEPERLREPIVTYTPQEAEIARQGVWRHINITYTGALERSKRVDIGLWAVYKMLYSQIDTYRQQANNIMTGLSRVLVTDEPGNRAYQAAALAPFLLGYEARNNGWPEKDELDDRLKEKFYEILAMDGVEVASLNKRGHGNAVENRVFWRDELFRSRLNPIAIALGKTINEARTEEIAEAA